MRDCIGQGWTHVDGGSGDFGGSIWAEVTEEPGKGSYGKNCSVEMDAMGRPSPGPAPTAQTVLGVPSTAEFSSIVN